jgi:hypothetical protein
MAVHRAFNQFNPPNSIVHAQLHINGKDYTWSSRQSTDMRKLIRALDQANIRSESDSCFGDSVMVIISPPGSGRQVKGQVSRPGPSQLSCL